MTDTTVVLPRFDNFPLHPAILRALEDEKYVTPTDVQRLSIPEVLAGRDLLATAQTGTGKTAAFSVPLLHLLHINQPAGRSGIRALILSPTRELALQIEASLRTYGRHLRLRTAVVLGGVASGPQIRALRGNPDILVATPGRLMDLMSQGYVKLESTEVLVLDEADRMLDMGFLPDVKRIVATMPAQRQTLFFSATMSPEIGALAQSLLRNPARVQIAAPAATVARCEQHVLFVDQEKKRDLLTDLLKNAGFGRSIVFTRTKHRADKISTHLASHGIKVDAIHSNKTQGARQRSLSAFDDGRIRVLVATDIVARGIDVDGISHVINYELPDDAENYVHRIGRTARAGADGVALSFCDAGEVGILRGIEKLTDSSLTHFHDHPFHSPEIAEMYARRQGSSSGRPQRGGGGGSRARSGGGGGGYKGGGRHGQSNSSKRDGGGFGGRSTGPSNSSMGGRRASSSSRPR